MIITTIQELRLASPAHALDSIDGLIGFIDNSEHDFLEDKLGTPLYNALCQWYDDNKTVRNSVSDYQTGYWNRLLLLAQRCVAFDALGRAIGMQAISVNNAGINVSVADDYPKADDKAMQTYRDTCNKEAHAALNQLLRQLEQWCKNPLPTSPRGGESGSTAGSPADDATTTPDGSPSGAASSTADDLERSEIVALWKQSRYYYLAAALLIPSCEVLQSYLNIYDSREKFIQLLPDLRFIQEEIIANSIGEDLLKIVIDFARDGKLPEPPAQTSDVSPQTSNLDLPSLVHRLRKVMVALLVGRTSVLKYDKEKKIQAHDDGVRMLANVTEYLKSLVPPEPAPAPEQPEQSPCGSHLSPLTSHLSTKDPALWTAPLL